MERILGTFEEDSHDEPSWQSAWTSEELCELRGARIRYVKDGQAKTTDAEIVALKGRSFFERYFVGLKGVKINNILEVGVFEGASAIMFSEMWPDARIVGIDIRPENPAVQRHIERLGLSDRIKLHYGVSQDDLTTITGIIDREFSEPLDLIVDDASHQYSFSRRTFEISFPLLRAGGFYAIEDWGWAHWRGFPQPPVWVAQPALSNLVFELVMACATNPEIVAEVTTTAVLTLIRKGPSKAPLITLAELFLTAGRTWRQL